MNANVTDEWIFPRSILALSQRGGKMIGRPLKPDSQTVPSEVSDYLGDRPTRYE